MIASLVFVEVVHLTKQSHHCILVIQYIAVMPFALSHIHPHRINATLAEDFCLNQSVLLIWYC